MALGRSPNGTAVWIVCSHRCRCPSGAGGGWNWMYLNFETVRTDRSCNISCSGGVCVIISRPDVGVFSRIGPNFVRPHLWKLWDILSIFPMFKLCDHIWAAYVTIGLITASYIQCVNFGEGPQVLPSTLVFLKNVFVLFLNAGNFLVRL